MEGGVLWYDLDGHFDMLHLVCLLQAHIHQCKVVRGGGCFVLHVVGAT
jgi:hypothetical protein